MVTNFRIFVAAGLMALIASTATAGDDGGTVIPPEAVSEFSKRLEPVGRILEEEDYYVWCCAPIFDSEGNVHVFYSRWLKEYGMGGWLGRCEVAHAVAESPEGPYRHVDAVLAPRPGYFDARTCHNPMVYEVDGRYWLFYMGSSDGKFGTKRIGYAVADSPWGPWTRCDEPLLGPGPEGAWDDYITTNPAYLQHPGGGNWLYYKSCNEYEYLHRNEEGISGNRRYGVAFADEITGPYRRYEGNPVVDFSVYGGNRQVEDAYIWYEDGKFRMLMRDMGFFDHTVGLYFESEDGLNWGEPQVGWFGTDHYFQQPPAPPHLTRYGRFERPQLLMKKGRPAYLFCTTQGGAAETSSGFVFRIRPE
ncbi:MAG: glycoside hydrolase family protein [Alistipes sp.]|nr:glycoside hydrolase family protein [Alistipes sp.]